MQQCGISCRERFLKQEKAMLRPLPQTPYSLKNSTRAKVKKNYHVVLVEDMHNYSVPHQYVGQQTSIVIVEIFLENIQRLAIHLRDTCRYGYSLFYLNIYLKPTGGILSKGDGVRMILLRWHHALVKIRVNG